MLGEVGAHVGGHPMYKGSPTRGVRTQAGCREHLYGSMAGTDGGTEQSEEDLHARG